MLDKARKFISEKVLRVPQVVKTQSFQDYANGIFNGGNISKINLSVKTLTFGQILRSLEEPCVATSIEMKSDVASQVPLEVERKGMKKVRGTTEETHPALEHLTRTLMDDICHSMFLYGNVFLLILGSPKYPEFHIIPPGYTTINNNNNNITVSALPKGLQGGEGVYKMPTQGDKDTPMTLERKHGIFVSEESDLRRLVHIKRRTNPNFMEGRYGEPRITSILAYVDIIKLSTIASFTQIQTSSSTSCLFRVGGSVDDDAFTEFKKMINDRYVGAHNTGRSIAVKGDKGDVEIMPLNDVREIHWLGAIKHYSEQIYNRLGIPLSLVGSEVTYENQLESKIYLIESSLPALEIILSDLTRTFKGLGLLADEEKISYDLARMDAYKQKKVDAVKKLADIGALTINEIRDELGEKADTSPEANEIMVNVNQVPLSELSTREDRPEEVSNVEGD